MDISNIVRSTPKLVLYLVIFQLNLNDLSIEVIEMVALLQALPHWRTHWYCHIKSIVHMIISENKYQHNVCCFEQFYQKDRQVFVWHVIIQKKRTIN